MKLFTLHNILDQRLYHGTGSDRVEGKAVALSSTLSEVTIEDDEGNRHKFSTRNCEFV